MLKRYEGKIFRLCCVMLRDRAQAEDAAQESLVRIWKALDRYDGSASLSSWIYAITRNRCLTALERRRVMDSLDDDAIEAEVANLTAADEGYRDERPERRERSSLVGQTGRSRYCHTLREPLAPSPKVCR